MTFINLGNPSVRNRESPYEEFTYPTGETLDLPRRARNIRTPVSDVLETRRTHRTFGKVSIRDLSSFFWWSAHTREAQRLPSGHIWEHRPAPSAGGRHVIDLMVIRDEQEGRSIYLYEPMTHRLVRLRVTKRIVSEFTREIQSVLDPMQGTVVVFVAQPKRISSKYRRGDSLIWRDAGVIVGFQAVVAEALNLSYCPLGITGDQFVQQAFPQSGALFGVGVSVVGARQHKGNA